LKNHTERDYTNPANLERMNALLKAIAAKNERLEKLRPLSPEALAKLALDHYDAIRYVRELGRQTALLTEGDLRNLHRLVVQRSRPDIAGRYADLSRYVRTETGRHSFPSPMEIPPLMGDLAAWLRTELDTPETAFTAHRRLVDIHPFNDGNGRTARLLMNLILIRAGYPPVAVRPEDRMTYVRSLQEAQAGQGTESFDTLLYERLDATLREYLSALI
jgi:Fic family protein